jgi:hypothetical protein
MRTLYWLLILAACGDNGKPAIDADNHVDIDAPERTKTIPLTGGANSVLWDPGVATLYLTDNNSNTLLKYTDENGVKTVGTFPPASAGVSLGDLVKRDNRILTANFGFGTQGTIFAITPTGEAVAMTGLDPARRRIGLAQDANGVVYTAYFVGGGMMMQTGGVSSVEITGDEAIETERAGGSTSAGFKKLVGIVATPTAVYVSDQTQKRIFKIDVPSYMVTPLAAVPSADLLAVMPNGDLLTGGGAAINRITPSGAVTAILEGEFEQVRGMAYDPALRRLFVIDHSATPGTPDKLQIRPLDN